MKKFMLLHIGFVQPTPEIMKAWQEWFTSISSMQIDQGGFGKGREISKGGSKDLAWNLESITGFNIIEAASFDEAEKIAHSNPFVSSIRVYELR